MSDWQWGVYTLAQDGPIGTPGVPTGTPGIPGGNGVEGAPGGAAPPAGRPGGGAFDYILPLLLGLMLFMIITSVMGQRKQKKQKEAMLGGIRKHDQVQTIGGVIGTVIEVRDNDVLVETDRASVTRIRFSKHAIQQVLKSGGGSGSGGESSGASTSQPELAQAAGGR
jgi:preprotein translocase subunit YajC